MVSKLRDPCNISREDHAVFVGRRSAGVSPDLTVWGVSVISSMFLLQRLMSAAVEGSDEYGNRQKDRRKAA